MSIWWRLRPEPAPRPFRVGLFTQLADLKVAVFFGANFVSMVPHGTPSWIMAAVLLMILLDEFLSYAVVARVVSLASVWAGHGRAKRWIDRAFGTAIAAFGVRIAVT